MVKKTILTSFYFKGMLENFAGLIKTYGLIPNGNRIYYTRRSQPPLFIAMVDEYYKVKMIHCVEHGSDVL